MIKLRDGSEVLDPRLGRLKQFDPRSRSWPIRAVVEGKPPRSYTWSVGTWLDQGGEGSCTGFAAAHELIGRPVRAQGITAQYARERIYWEAQKIDPWEGGSYPGASPSYEGSSVLAATKVCQGLGHFDSYRWAFGLEDLILALGYAGPAVLGINWYRDMAQTESDGRIRPRGELLGGHAILAHSVRLKSGQHPGAARVWLWNSWGKSFGLDGRCWLSLEDLEKLLGEQGEAVIPLKRRLLRS